MGAMMPLTMRPTGGHSPVYADRQDWTILDDGKPVGRVYEDASASTRWFWSITVYVDPRAGVFRRWLRRTSRCRCFGVAFDKPQFLPFGRGENLKSAPRSAGAPATHLNDAIDRFVVAERISG